MQEVFTRPEFLLAAKIYAGGFLLFLLFNLWMRRRNRLVMTTTAFHFSLGETFAISALWPLCFVGFVFYSIVFIIVHIPDMLPPYGKKHGKARFDYASQQVVYDMKERSQAEVDILNASFKLQQEKNQWNENR